MVVPFYLMLFLRGLTRLAVRVGDGDFFHLLSHAKFVLVQFLYLLEQILAIFPKILITSSLLKQLIRQSSILILKIPQFHRYIPLQSPFLIFSLTIGSSLRLTIPIFNQIRKFSPQFQHLSLKMEYPISTGFSLASHGEYLAI